MDKQAHPQFVGRSFTNKEVTYYSSPIDTYGAKITDNKYIMTEGEGTKIRINKSVFFYTSGAALNVIKVKSGKGSFDEHKKLGEDRRVVDFVFPPNSKNQALSLDDKGGLMIWMYKYKDTFTYGVIYQMAYDVEITSMQCLMNPTATLIVCWSEEYFCMTHLTANSPGGSITAGNMFLQTDKFSEKPSLMPHYLMKNPKKYKVGKIKDFVISTNRCYGFILHDENKITVVSLQYTALMYQAQITDISEDLDRIFYKDFGQGTLEATQGGPPVSGTLILTAEGNTSLFTADIFVVQEELRIVQNCQLSFQKDKTHK